MIYQPKSSQVILIILKKDRFVMGLNSKESLGNHLIKSRDSHHNSVDENTTLSTNLDINNKLSTSITEQESADGWVSMDADLLKLWNNNITCRELSLIIIRTLFEDIYLLDDPISSKEAPY